MRLLRDTPDGPDSSVLDSTAIVLLFEGGWGYDPLSGDSEGALREYQRSIELYDDPATWLKIASLHEARGDKPGVLAAFEGALRNAPDEVDLLLAASWLAHELGDDAKARGMLLHAAEVAPDHPQVRKALRRVAASNAPPAQ